MKRTEGQGSLLVTQDPEPHRTIECLGLAFESDSARRAYFVAKLKEYLKHPDFRRTEGFPVGSDEDILALSDPPYYTACPNPFAQDFVRHYGKPYDANVPYTREPFAADVTEGKNDPIYNAHSYHTKVPHKAIMRYILHYTEPGDLVLDGFCGTGMTGVAAAQCARPDENVRASTATARPGQRPAILIDLSPVATFIASNLLRPFDKHSFDEAVESVCSTVQREFGHLYLTEHTGWKVRDRKALEHKAYRHKGDQDGVVDFTLYSDVVRCPECDTETTLYAVAVDEQSDSLRDDLKCPYCEAFVPEAKWEPVFTTDFDPVLGQTIRHIRIEPVLINYTVGTTRYEKVPDAKDKEKLKISHDLLRAHGLKPVQMIAGTETQRNVRIGVTHLHHFFTAREHLFISVLLKRIQEYPDQQISLLLRFVLTAALPYASRLRRFRADRKGGGPLSGTLYISSLITPPHILKTFRRNAATIADSLYPPVDPARHHLISTQDVGSLAAIPDESVDYIFTDPPFGHNFDYSELNFFWEGLLGVVTNQQKEAIISVGQKKGLNDYRELMGNCFVEYYRVLKPGRWITVEFSNTQAAVWNAIQFAMERSGFVVANVASLDKKQHSFKAVTTPTAVKQDLIISAYKPNGGLEGRFKMQAGTIDGAWDFVRTHLKQLPVFLSRDGRADAILERQPHLLYDRMVAFHVQRGVTIPLSAGDFFSGLGQRFIEREGMYFLPEQAAEYDRARLTTKEARQLEIFIRDETSAIEWLRQELQDRPRTFQDLNPLFLREVAGWSKQERLLDLRELLEENFIRYDGQGDVPSQIHKYLSTNFHDFRNLSKSAEPLKAKAKDRWYVPDPNKAGDLEKLRERALLREFDEYRQLKQKKLKVLRLEAIRAGFRRAWQQNDYSTILEVAARIPEDVIQEDPMLLMWYTNSQMRAGRS